MFKFSPDHLLEHISTHQVFPQDILILSFAWYPYPRTVEKSDLPVLALTLSTGSVQLVRFTDWDFVQVEILNDTEPLISHSLEAWCCVFSTPCNNEVVHIYSGGDDAKLRMISVSPKPIIKSESHTQFSQDTEISAVCFYSRI